MPGRGLFWRHRDRFIKTRPEHSRRKGPVITPPSFFREEPLLLYSSVWLKRLLFGKNSVSQIDERRIKAPGGSGAETDVRLWLRGRLWISQNPLPSPGFSFSLCCLVKPNFLSTFWVYYLFLFMLFLQTVQQHYSLNTGHNLVRIVTLCEILSFSCKASCHHKH